jgi:hypothetical protein
MYTDANGDQGERPSDDKRLHDDESSSFEGVSQGGDVSATSRSTQRFFLEGDDMEFEDKIIATHHWQASILRAPMLESTSAAARSLNQRVRFKLPEPLPWSDSDEESVIMIQSPALTGDAEAWVSWIMNPVFDSMSACTPLDCTPGPLERSSSPDSSVTSLSPILPRFENTSSDFESRAPDTTPQVVSPEREATMGIQNLYRGDDSDNAVFLEIGVLPATERKQDSGVLSQLSIASQVSVDEGDDDDGMHEAGSEYGPGMYEI